MEKLNIQKYKESWKNIEKQISDKKLKKMNTEIQIVIISFMVEEQF